MSCPVGCANENIRYEGKWRLGEGNQFGVTVRMGEAMPPRTVFDLHFFGMDINHSRSFSAQVFGSKPPRS